MIWPFKRKSIKSLKMDFAHRIDEWTNQDPSTILKSLVQDFVKEYGRYPVSVLIYNVNRDFFACGKLQIPTDTRKTVPSSNNPDEQFTLSVYAWAVQHFMSNATALAFSVTALQEGTPHIHVSFTYTKSKYRIGEFVASENRYVSLHLDLQ